MIDFTTLGWLLEVEAAMVVHEQVYPQDRRWRRWIRTQELDAAWFDALRRHARAVLDGRAARFLDAEDEIFERYARLRR